jgi:hypothetical protein
MLASSFTCCKKSLFPSWLNTSSDFKSDPKGDDDPQRRACLEALVGWHFMLSSLNSALNHRSIDISLLPTLASERLHRKL